MACGRLAADGIDAIVADDAVVQIHWLYSLAVGGVKVRVDESDAERAIAILRDVQNIHPATDDGRTPTESCPRCGSEDLSFYRVSKIRGAVSFLIGLPLELPRRRARCKACGFYWRQSGLDWGVPDATGAATLAEAESALRQEAGRVTIDRRPWTLESFWPIILIVMVGIAFWMLYSASPRSAAF